MAQDQTGAPIRDHRQIPAGVLPRNLQMWLMAGLALVILTIIVFTGRSTPPPRAAAPDARAESPAALSDRIRTYRQQLAADQARQEQLLAQAKNTPVAEPTRGTNPDTTSRDGLVEERRRRNYQSLFADSVALSRRKPGEPSSGEPTRSTSLDSKQAAVMPGLEVSPAMHPAVTAPTTPVAEATHDEHPAPGPRLRLLEGTVIEAALTNRLDGSLAGPVNGLVTTPVYALDRQSVLIPAGARVLGTAAPVQSWGESRLAISFHRLVMPDGHTYSLDKFKGLDQIGATGLRDEVNRHYLQVFGASLAIGAIAGLAQYNTYSGLNYTFGDAYRQAAGASLATSTARVLDRYLNVLPTITIREGFRMKVYLTNDLELPAYAAVTSGGDR